MTAWKPLPFTWTRSLQNGGNCWYLGVMARAYNLLRKAEPVLDYLRLHSKSTSKTIDFLSQLYCHRTITQVRQVVLMLQCFWRWSLKTISLYAEEKQLWKKTVDSSYGILWVMSSYLMVLKHLFHTVYFAYFTAFHLCYSFTLHIRK